MLNKRQFLVSASVSICAVTAGCSREASAKSYPVRYTDAQWKKRLTKDQYFVLRKAGTEAPGSSPLDKEKRKGNFHCAGCDNALFRSADKYDSGTGWPSFFRPIKGAIGKSTDYNIGVARTEVHCARCGGHLGHVFDDGPKPTGLRYCMNGDAMLFRAG